MQRPVRVFVSSTFADMRAERNELALRVFPELRDMCDQRGATWSDIDLRWGITPEQIADDRLLPLCFDAIEDCWPFFIAFIGQRYGTRIEIGPELLRSQPWLADHRGKSVTELEILRAEREPDRRMFFYFRDPSYLDTVPQDRRTALESAEQHDRAALEALRERAVASGKFVRTYQTPAEAGALVAADLRRAIDEIAPPLRFTDPFAEEVFDHEAFASHAAHNHAIRSELVNTLDRHLLTGKAPLVVTGAPGSGKSALLAYWANRHRTASQPEFSMANRLLKQITRYDARDVLLVAHFVEASRRSSNWSRIVLRVIDAVRRHFDLALPIPQTVQALRMMFSTWLHAVPGGERLILVIDGLDHLNDDAAALDLGWLPESFPRNVAVVVSTAAGRPLDELRRRDWPIMDIPPLDRRVRREIVSKDLEEGHRSLRAPTVEVISDSPACAQPLFLRVVLNELRVFGEFDRLETKISQLLQATSAEGLYDGVLERLEFSYESLRPNLVSDALTRILVARDGLSSSELRELLGDEAAPLPAAIWLPLYLALKSSLIDRGGVLSIARPELRDAVRKRYFPHAASIAAIQRHLAEYFGSKAESPRKLAEYPDQLVELRAWDELFGYLRDPSVLVDAWHRDRARATTWWRMIESNSRWRAADAYATLRHVDPDAVDSLVAACELLSALGSTVEALDLAQRMESTARARGDQRALQRALNQAALLLQRRGDLSDALAKLDQEREVCSLIGDPAVLAACCGNRGVVLRAMNRVAEADSAFRDAERVSDEIDDMHGVAMNLGNRAALAADVGDPYTSLAYSKKQEHLGRKLGDRRILALSFGNQGTALARLGRLLPAAACYEAEEKFLIALGDEALLQVCLGNRALIEQRRAAYDDADELLTRRESICRRINDADGLASTLIQRAFLVAVKLGVPDLAGPFLIEARQIATAHGLAMRMQEINRLTADLNTPR